MEPVKILEGFVNRVPGQLWVAYGLLAICLILLFFTSESGLSPERMIRILSSAAPLGVVTIAQTIVIINRGLDLSVGPIMNTAGIMTAVLSASTGGNVSLTIVIVVAVGLAIGLVNGLLLAFTRIPPLLGTLATATIIQGMYSLFTRGQPRGYIPDELRYWADGRLWTSPVSPSLLIWIGLLVLGAISLSRTVPGRRFYAVGANRRAAWFSGVPITSHTIAAYAISGALSSVAGILLISYSGSPSLTSADDYALNSVVAAVIGGAVLLGGSGGMSGAFVGAAVLAFLNSVLLSFSVPSAVQLMITGGVLIGMLFINSRIESSRRYV